jgi:hypothetical protein
MGRIEETQAAFLEVYQKNVWGMSGDIEPEPQNVAQYVRLVADFLRQNEVKSVVEFGCSAWPHLHRVDWTGIEYDGYDVVGPVVELAVARYAAKNIRFHISTDETELSPADLLICKDVFQHLPNEDISYYLNKFHRLYKFMLITDDVYPDSATNQDIQLGGYRAIRLDLPPFGQRCAVVQRLEGTTFGSAWIKHTCLLFGAPTEPANSGKSTGSSTGVDRNFIQRGAKLFKAALPGKRK